MELVDTMHYKDAANSDDNEDQDEIDDGKTLSIDAHKFN
jgi:hypothetical protein